MNPSALTPSLSEPSHDEIALTAFLQWEQDGRQSGRDMFYWHQAETQLRELYRQRAERAAAAVQAVRPWPPLPVAEPTKSTAPKTAAPKSRRATKPKAAAPAPVSPAKRESKPVRMASPLATASRLTTVHPVVAATKVSKPSAGTRSSARR